MQYIPFGSKIIIKKVEEVKTGMIIPKSVSQEEKAIGEIVAISDDFATSKLKIGDRIVYDEFSGNLIPGDDTLTILDIKYVLAIIKYD
jgi:co-chaperonin GroES (HSP10)